VKVAYTIYHNQGPGRFWKAGTETDPYKVGYTGVIPDDVQSDLFEWVFFTHNQDDRPDGRVAPSLSVGDVVAITTYHDEQTHTMWRTVDSFGFSPVGIPTNVEEKE
jgi:hypothetical protein